MKPGGQSGVSGEGFASPQTTGSPTGGTHFRTLALADNFTWRALVLAAAATCLLVMFWPSNMAFPGGDWARNALAAAAILVLVITFYDLQARARGAARRPEGQTLDRLLDMLPMGAVIWNESGRLEHCNKILRRHYELPEAGPLSGAEVEAFRDCGAPDRATGQARTHEVERPDGGWLQVSTMKLTDGRTLCVTRDVTDHRRTRQELATSLRENRSLTLKYHEQALRAEEASRSKSAFLAHLSHDIRTPLNHIIGFAELILHETFGPVGDARYSTYLGDIKRSGERLLHSFGDVLELAELDGGQRSMPAEPVRVADLFGHLEERFGPTASRAGLELRFGPEPSTRLMGDRAALQRMICNLVDNAVRFTPRGGRIDVSAWEASDGMILEISDTGIGIPPARLRDLSVPFALGDAAFARESGGMGLGIAIARAIAEQSGGALHIESTPSLGTTVALSLPAAAAEATAGEAA